MAMFRKLVVALAFLSLIIDLASEAQGQQFVLTQKKTAMTVPEAMLHQLFNLNSEPRIVQVTHNEKEVKINWLEYYFPDGPSSHTFRIFFKPDTNQEWFWYHSFDKVSPAAGKDGKFQIQHEATIWIVKRPLLWPLRQKRPRELVTYRGDSIDKSKDKLGQAIKRKLKVELPSSIEL